MPNFLVYFQSMDSNISRCVDSNSHSVSVNADDHDFDFAWPVADYDDFACFSRKC